MSLIGSIPGMGGGFLQGMQGQNGMQALQQAMKQMQGPNASGAQGLTLDNLSGVNLETLQKQGLKAAEGYATLAEAERINPRPVNTADSPSFATMLKDLVDGVDKKQKAGADAARDVMLGKSDNIHQAMIAMQEAGVAFNLLVEVRNKLVESYKELSRMQV